MAFRLGLRCIVATPDDATWCVNKLQQDLSPVLNAGTEIQTASIPEYNGDPDLGGTPSGRYIALGIATFQRRGDSQRIQGELQAAAQPTLDDPRVISYTVIQAQD
jgi:hypothetical protein